MFEQPPPSSGTFFSQRLRLHYVDWGNYDAPPLLLIHGGRDHCRSWDWVARELRKDWHVIAPDLRGHGDSGWDLSGTYSINGFFYDLAQIIHQKTLSPVTILAHSFGGVITLRYAGVYPETIRKIVSIEGLHRDYPAIAAYYAKPVVERLREWVTVMRGFPARSPRRYPDLASAIVRMQEENARLTYEQAHHLTLHGINQNEDGTFSWKFDPYVRNIGPLDISLEETRELWGRIEVPLLFIYGRESWAKNPAETGRLGYFPQAKLSLVDGAGHWVHHDRLDVVLGLVKEFLAE